MDRSRSSVRKSDNGESHFLRHLKPLQTLVRWIGIDLMPFTTSSSKHVCLKRFMGFVLFFVHVFCNFKHAAFYLMPLFYREPSPYNTSPFFISSSGSAFWNIIIDFCNFNFLNIGGHAVVLNLFYQPEWKLLWSHLERMTEEQQHSKQFQSVCRRATVYGVVILLVVIMFYLNLVFG